MPGLPSYQPVAQPHTQLGFSPPFLEQTSYAVVQDTQCSGRERIPGGAYCIAQKPSDEPCQVPPSLRLAVLHQMSYSLPEVLCQQRLVMETLNGLCWIGK